MAGDETVSVMAGATKAKTCSHVSSFHAGVKATTKYELE
jgi:hypothetical protein